MTENNHFIKDFNGWHPVKKRLDTLNDKAPDFYERDVWWCSVGVDVGFEIFGKGKEYTRPVLILKRFGYRTFMGIPMTSKRKENRPYHYPIDFKGESGALLIDQMRIFDTNRLHRRAGKIGSKRFKDIQNFIAEKIL